MTGIETLSKDMVARSVNFHGHQLLQQLTNSYPHDIEALNLKEIDYKVYKARLPEISRQTSFARNELLNFITGKFSRLFKNHEQTLLPDEDEEDYGCKDRTSNLPPLEYFMKVDSQVVKNMFFKSVKRGDILYARVASHVHESVHILKVQAKTGMTVHDLSDADIKAHLRVEDTKPDTTDSDNLGRWLLRTKLCVEVLEVDASDFYLLVGTKGVTIPHHLKEKITLGKITINDRPPIMNAMQNRMIKSYSQTLERLTMYTNPRSIRHLASRFNIDPFSHSSLMGTLRYKFPEREMYKPLRKAQMSRWAHKSVADGVVFFKRGQHEEAFQCLNKALQIDNENVEAFVAKGALLANLGRLEKAVQDFEEALKYNPKHGNARKYICETLVELGRQLEEDNKLEEAEEKYKKCLEINSEHPGGTAALAALNRKLGRVAEPQLNLEPDLVQTVLKDLVEIEEENSRKRQRTNSTSKDSPPAKRDGASLQSEWSRDSNQSDQGLRSRSLSPLSAKMAMQEGKWHPPPSINTTSSYLGSVPSAAISVPPPTCFNYPPPQHPWPPAAVMSSQPQVPAPQMFGGHPSTYPAQPQGSYVNKEDEEYKARVDRFLKDLDVSRSLDKKERDKKSQSRGRESRSRKKRRDSNKKRGRSSRSSSSSSSHSSVSSRSSSSSTFSRSSDSSSSRKSRKRKYKKKKTRKIERKEKKGNRTEKQEKKIKEGKSKPKSQDGQVEDDQLPELKSLNEKLTAYYKKVKDSQRQPLPSDKKNKEKVPSTNERSAEKDDSIAEMMKVMKNYEQGFRISAKLKTKAAGAASVKGVHPIFQESDEEDVFDQPGSSIMKQVPSTINRDKTSISYEIKQPPEIHSEPPSKEMVRAPVVSGRRSPSASCQRAHSHSESPSRSRPPSYSQSPSQSRSPSRSQPRSHFRSHSRSKSRSRSKDRSKLNSRNYSRSPQRSHLRSRDSSLSRSPRYSHYKLPHQSRAYFHSRHSREKDIMYDDERWLKSNVREMKKENLTHQPQGGSQHSLRRDQRDIRKGHNSSDDLPDPLSDWERKAVIEAVRQKLESHVEVSEEQMGLIEAVRDKLEAEVKFRSGGWDEHSPHAKSDNLFEMSYKKTPSRWDSSHPKTSSRWDSSHPKTPSRRESSHPRTSSRLDSSHPKTPSRRESCRPKTPSRWETSRHKTSSRWDTSHPKSPSRYSNCEPKTPGRWSDSKEHIDDSDKASQSRTHSKQSPDSNTRFGKWDDHKKSNNGDCRIGTSLSEMETFVEAAKQKKMEKMKERNKAFLKPNVD